MAGIDDELLMDEQENQREIAFIREQLPTELKDCYSDDQLLWMLDTLVSNYVESGVLDTELYEEPYTWVSDYEVAVTFSDLAVLDRLKWSGEGLWTVRGIIDHCISESGVNVNGLQLQHSLCSYSSGSGDTPIDLSTLQVNAANFYDEDGEAMTLREVLEAVLQPLALRLTQKGGRLWLQDLHTLATTAPARQVEWLADDGVLGGDKGGVRLLSSTGALEDIRLSRMGVYIKAAADARVRLALPAGEVKEFAVAAGHGISISLY